MTKPPRVFYGWYLVGLAIFGLALIFGIRASFSVFFEPALEQFGWYRGSAAFMFSLNLLIYGLFAPLVGMLVDRWKPRVVVMLGLCFLSLTTAALYFASELWQFYVLFGVLMPIGMALAGSPVLNPMLINWFGKKRGLALGLGQLGGGLSFVYTLIVQAIIAIWKWQVIFPVMGAIIIFILLPLYLGFFYFRPEDKGLKAYRVDVSGDELKEEALSARDWTLTAAFKTYQLWVLISAGFFIWGIGNYMIMAHQIKFAEDVGFSSLQATSVFALTGLIAMPGQVLSSISDKIGREITLLISIVLVIGGMVALLLVRDASQLWLLYLYAVLNGLATGIFSPLLIVGTADIFRGRNVGTLSAMMLMGSGVGGAIGPWLGGYIYDIFHSYQIAFFIAIAGYAAGGFCYWLAAPRKAESLRARAMRPI